MKPRVPLCDQSNSMGHIINAAVTVTFTKSTEKLVRTQASQIHGLHTVSSPSSRPAKSHASRASLTHFRPLKYYLTHFILSQLRVNFVRHVVVTRTNGQKN